MILERETGIEPATNSLEGCDSTTELLPPARCPLRSTLRRASPRAFNSLPPPNTLRPTRDGWPANRNPPPLKAPAAKVGGEGRVRTSVGTRPADLQSAAIDRSATYPKIVPRESTQSSSHWRLRARTYVLDSPGYALVDSRGWRRVRWSWRRDLNPRPADYKSAALPG